ncbi:hypothetical protein D9M71_660140 [compost metagenome]
MANHVTEDMILEILDSFRNLEGKDISPYFSACMEWIKESCNNSQKTIYASIYCYCLRQLKYPNTNKKLAVSILELSKNKILDTLK